MLHIHLTKNTASRYEAGDARRGATPERNFRHYEPLCAHGSSLSAGMHTLVAARLGDVEMALRYLRETADTDLDLDPNSAGGVRIAGLGTLDLMG